MNILEEKKVKLNERKETAAEQLAAMETEVWDVE